MSSGSSRSFAHLKSATRGNASRQFFVPFDWFEKLIEAAPDRDWKTIIALCRLAGLRCPSEVLRLRWKDITPSKGIPGTPGYTQGSLIIHSPKTEHHEGGDCRRCPLFADLEPY